MRKARKQKKEAGLDFRQLFDSLPGIYLLLAPDNDFRIVAASKNYLKVNNCTRSQAEGHRLFDVFNASSCDLNKDELSALGDALKWVRLHKKGYELMQKYTVPKIVDGIEEAETRYWNIIIKPALRDNGSLDNIIIQMNDAAAIVRSKERGEAQLRRTRALEDIERESMKRIKESEEQLRQLNGDLEHSIAQLELANRELDSFCYSVSHDLHAPLRAISGYANILRDNLSLTADNEALDMLVRINNNVGIMKRQIDDLLSFSRMSKDEINTAKVNMSKIARDSIDIALHGQNTPLTGKVKPSIKLNELPSAKADRNMIEHVFTNLISNAIKYSSKTAKPEIEIGSNIAKNSNVYWVKDNGIGFDMKYADSLFILFRRLHRKKDFDGSGVGLALVKRIVIRHGGKVWAKAKPNRGATFFFSLPAPKND